MPSTAAWATNKITNNHLIRPTATSGHRAMIRPTRRNKAPRAAVVAHTRLAMRNVEVLRSEGADAGGAGVGAAAVIRTTPWALDRPITPILTSRVVRSWEGGPCGSHRQ